MLRSDVVYSHLSQEGIVAKGEEMFFVYPKEQQQQGEAHERRDDEFPYVVEKINPDTRNFTDYTGGHGGYTSYCQQTGFVLCNTTGSCQS